MGGKLFSRIFIYFAGIGVSPPIWRLCHASIDSPNKVTTWGRLCHSRLIQKFSMKGVGPKLGDLLRRRGIARVQDLLGVLSAHL